MYLLPAVASGPPLLDVIHHCDALTLLRALPDESVDLIVTSPPYDNLRTYNGYTWDFENIARQSYRVLKRGGVLVWVVGDATIDGCETLTSMRQAIYFVDSAGFKMHDTMIYQKTGMAFPNSNRYYQIFEYMFVLSKGVPKSVNLIADRQNISAGRKVTGLDRNADGTFKNRTGLGKICKQTGIRFNVWQISNGERLTNHPAPFPEDLARDHILSWSNPGDIVLDYFGGSGTTAKMARQNGRHYITCDISAEYVDLMKRRLALPYTLPMFA